MWIYIAIAATVVVTTVTLVIALRSLVRRMREAAQLRDARESFHRRREWLEAQFLTAAGRSGKPRGLAWVNCDFANDVTLGRDRKTGELKAFVACTISFEAIEGGGMENVEAVGNLRAATAVFYRQDGKWTTDGLALFNVQPGEAIERFRNEVELVE